MIQARVTGVTSTFKDTVQRVRVTGSLGYPRYPTPSTGLPLYLWRFTWLPHSLDRVTSVSVLVHLVTPLPRLGYPCICAGSLG